MAACSFPHCSEEGIPSRHGFCRRHADALDRVTRLLGAKLKPAARAANEEPALPAAGRARPSPQS
jgi:hypothetical protein